MVNLTSSAGGSPPRRRRAARAPLEGRPGAGVPMGTGSGSASPSGATWGVRRSGSTVIPPPAGSRSGLRFGTRVLRSFGPGCRLGLERSDDRLELLEGHGHGVADRVQLGEDQVPT